MMISGENYDKYSSQPIKTFDQRIEESVPVLPKPNLKKKSRQKSPLTTNGFEGYAIKKEKEDQSGQIKTSIYRVAGPIPNNSRMITPSFLNPTQQYDEEIISNWIPQLSLSVYDESVNRSLTAAEIEGRMQTSKWMPHFFMNPMQDLDYITIESLVRFTFIGPLMDALTKFIVGTKFTPELELISPTNDEDADKQTIDENQDIIESLIQIDNQISQDDSGYMDTSFTEKISALISTASIFNRSALIFGYEKPVEINGKKYSQIPNSLKFAHARDLGIIDAEPGTWRLRAVQWRNAYNMIPASEMIYLWNPLISAKTRGSWLYGDSMIMPMVDAARVIRKNIGVNFPAMAEATWAGMFLMAVKPDGKSLAEKQKEYEYLVQNMVRGGPNLMMVDPNNVKFENIDFNPKITEFSALTEMMIKYCIATTGMPHSLFYDEDSSNRATLIGKIQLAIATVINPKRAWISRMVSNQSYQRWFKVLYQDKPEIYNKFRIKMAFSDLHIEEWSDKIESVNNLDSRKQLTDKAYGELAGIDNYANKVQQDAQTIPGGNGSGKKLNVDSGEGFQISKGPAKK